MTLQQLWRYAPMTIVLIASFVLMTLYQMMAGVSIDAQTNADLIRFGADFVLLSMNDEPWRLLTSAFLHIGLMHLLFNGFAMYFFGQVVEAITGSVRFLVLFGLSVVGGNLLSNYQSWQAILAGELPAISAGASGGIMGMGAFLLVLALMKAPIGIQLNTKSLAIVMGLNIIMGFAIAGIDNAGHIGGMLTGAVLGVALSAERRLTHRLGHFPYFWATAMLLALGFMGFWWVLQGEVVARL